MVSFSGIKDSVNTLQMHCSRRDIIPLAAVFSPKKKEKKTKQKEEDIFPLGLGLSSAMIELSVTADHAITCLI